MSLHNLGCNLRELDLYEDALLATQEAVEIRRRLAASHPDAFLPRLSISLGNLAIDLNNLGRYDEALSVAEEAVKMLLPFFMTYPAAFFTWMGNNVRFYRDSCQALGRKPDSELLTPIDEALARLSSAEPKPEG